MAFTIEVSDAISIIPGKLFQPYWFQTKVLNLWKHCLKSVQIQSYFWSVFSCIRTEDGDSVFSPNTVRIQSKYRKILTRNNSVFGHFSHSVTIRWQQYSAVSRNPACVINNWNNSSKCLWTNKVIHIFYKISVLLIWFNIKTYLQCLQYLQC